jgi:polar amino acid transport system substrate-binding protein
VAARNIDRRAFLRNFTALSGGCGLLSACGRADFAEPGGGTLLARLRAAGEVRVGYSNEAPYSYIGEDAELTGEAAELAKVVFCRLGVEEIVPVPCEFGSLIAGLKVGLFDVIAAGMAIRQDRCAQVLFTDPEFVTPAAFLVPAGNPHGVRTFTDVARQRLRLGVLSGGVERSYARQAGVRQDQVVAYPDPSRAMDAVRSGALDAFASTTISLRHALSRDRDARLAVTAPFVPVLNGDEQFTAGAFAFPPDQERIVTEFNAELAQLKKSGQLLEIMRPFGFTDAEMTDMRANELCTNGRA